MRKLQSLRLAAKKYGQAHVEKIFVEAINREYPELRYNNRPIESSTDFCCWLKVGELDNKKREIIFFAVDGLWGGENNQWAVNLEEDFADLLNIEFTGVKCNGTRQQRATKGRCFCTIFVDVKGSLCDKIRNACKKKYKEAPYRYVNRFDKCSFPESSNCNSDFLA